MITYVQVYTIGLEGKMTWIIGLFYGRIARKSCRHQLIPAHSLAVEKLAWSFGIMSCLYYSVGPIGCGSVDTSGARGPETIPHKAVSNGVVTHSCAIAIASGRPAHFHIGLDR